MRYEPANTVERIADAGMSAMEATARAEGVELRDGVIFMSIERAPDGELDSATHPFIKAAAEPEPVDVLAHACAHVQSLAKSIGIPLQLTIRGQRLGG